MAEMCILTILLVSVLAGAIFVDRRIKNINGVALLLSIGLAGLAVFISISRLLLFYASPQLGYDFDSYPAYAISQSFLSVLLGAFLLAVYYYLRGSEESRVISYAFGWIAAVLLISGIMEILVSPILVSSINYKLVSLIFVMPQYVPIMVLFGSQWPEQLSYLPFVESGFVIFVLCQLWARKAKNKIAEALEIIGSGLLIFGCLIMVLEYFSIIDFGRLSLPTILETLQPAIISLIALAAIAIVFGKRLFVYRKEAKVKK